MASSHSADDKHIQATYRHTESTMNDAAANSGAYALIRLIHQQFGFPEEDIARLFAVDFDEKANSIDAKFKKEIEKEIDTLLESCSKEIKKEAEELARSLNGDSKDSKDTKQKYDWLPAINYMLNVKIKEPLTKYDEANVYFEQTNTQIRCKFPLKLALVTVWKAIHDNKKFMHHYEGSEAKAHKDLPFRLQSFFNALQNIHQSHILEITICHHGHRNEIIYILNHLYQNFDLIADPQSLVFDTLRQKLSNEFLELYKKAPDPSHLNALIIKWMSSGNAEKIFEVINPYAKISDNLKKQFLRNGVNPNKFRLDFWKETEFTNLDNIINGILQKLSFDCHPKDNPTLFQINQIFNYVELDEKKPEAIALEKMQKWLSTAFKFNDKKDKVILEDFISFYEAHHALIHKKALLKLTDNWIDVFDDLLKDLKSYIENFDPTKPLSPELISKKSEMDQRAKLLKDKVKASESDAQTSKIENFFVFWYAHQENHDQVKIKILYNELLSDALKKKIIFKDENLKTYFAESKDHKGEVTITPYILNRIFLQAIILGPEDWTKAFAKRLYTMIKFVENKFNAPGEFHADTNLQKSSYPQSLLKQLKYHYAQYRKKHQSEQDIKDFKDEKNAADEKAEDALSYDRIIPPIPDYCLLHEWPHVLDLIDNKEIRFNTYNLYLEKFMLIRPIQELQDIYNRFKTALPWTLYQSTPEIFRLRFVNELRRKYVFATFVSYNHPTPTQVFNLLSEQDKIKFLADLSEKDCLLYIHNVIILEKLITAQPKFKTIEFLKKAFSNLNPFLENRFKAIDSDEEITALTNILKLFSFDEASKLIESIPFTNLSFLLKAAKGLKHIDAKAENLEEKILLKLPETQLQKVTKNWADLGIIFSQITDDTKQIELMKKLSYWFIVVKRSSILDFNLNSNKKNPYGSFFKNLITVCNDLKTPSALNIMFTDQPFRNIFKKLSNEKDQIPYLLENLTPSTKDSLIQTFEDIYLYLPYRGDETRTEFITRYIKKLTTPGFQSKDYSFDESLSKLIKISKLDLLEAKKDSKSIAEEVSIIYKPLLTNVKFELILQLLSATKEKDALDEKAAKEDVEARRLFLLEVIYTSNPDNLVQGSWEPVGELLSFFSPDNQRLLLEKYFSYPIISLTSNLGYGEKPSENFLLLLENLHQLGKLEPILDIKGSDQFLNACQLLPKTKRTVDLILKLKPSIFNNVFQPLSKDITELTSPVPTFRPYTMTMTFLNSFPQEYRLSLLNKIDFNIFKIDDMLQLPKSAQHDKKNSASFDYTITTVASAASLPAHRFAYLTFISNLIRIFPEQERPLFIKAKGISLLKFTSSDLPAASPIFLSCYKEILSNLPQEDRKNCLNSLFTLKQIINLHRNDYAFELPLPPNDKILYDLLILFIKKIPIEIKEYNKKAQSYIFKKSEKRNVSLENFQNAINAIINTPTLTIEEVIAKIIVELNKQIEATKTAHGLSLFESGLVTCYTNLRNIFTSKDADPYKLSADQTKFERPEAATASQSIPKDHKTTDHRDHKHTKPAKK